MGCDSQIFHLHNQITMKIITISEVTEAGDEPLCAFVSDHDDHSSEVREWLQNSDICGNHVRITEYQNGFPVNDEICNVSDLINV